MRNPERIQPFCNELAKVWKENFPDWRFGQFMMNFLGELSLKIDPFFPEDDKMIEYLHKYVSREEAYDNAPETR